MLTRIVIAAVVVLGAVMVARFLQSRRQLDPPTQRRYQTPSQLDRNDFADPQRPWLVTVFTSDTCSTCADVVDKAQVVASDEVAVDIVSYQARGDDHERYGIDAVPMVLIVDRDGVVNFDHIGPISATDLWAELAAARDAADG